jgi:large subunit ribosomal protein L18
MDRMLKLKKSRNARIKKGIRHKVNGTAERPRLTVYRSNKEIYAQLIDDVNGHTVAAASTAMGEYKSLTGTPIEKATAIGKELARKASEASINAVVFDRNGYLYHGRVKALADGAREGGLQF